MQFKEINAKKKSLKNIFSLIIVKTEEIYKKYPATLLYSNRVYKGKIQGEALNVLFYLILVKQRKYNVNKEENNI